MKSLSLILTIVAVVALAVVAPAQSATNPPPAVVTNSFNLKDLIGIDVGKAFDWVASLPPAPLTCLAVLLLGFAIKRTEWIPNRSIPLVLMIVGPILLILARYGLMRFAVEGMIYSGVVWLFHAQIWKRIAPLIGGNPKEFDSNPAVAIKKTDPPTPPAPNP